MGIQSGYETIRLHPFKIGQNKYNFVLELFAERIIDVSNGRDLKTSYIVIQRLFVWLVSSGPVSLQ